MSESINSHDIWNFFVINVFVTVICDQRSLTLLLQKSYNSLKAHVVVAFLTIIYFFKPNITRCNDSNKHWVVFSYLVLSDSLQHHGKQHARLPCSLLSSGIGSNSCPLSQWCYPTISSSVTHFSIFPSIRVFPIESALCIRWPRYWSFSSSISPSNEYSGLISFIMDWFDLLAVQGTTKGLLQHHSSKASVPQCSAFFMAQLSHPNMTTGKTIALTLWTAGSQHGRSLPRQRSWGRALMGKGGSGLEGLPDPTHDKVMWQIKTQEVP